MVKSLLGKSKACGKNPSPREQGVIRANIRENDLKNRERWAIPANEAARRWRRPH
jgi:hypothetical protein